jgi:hypothetical protein
MPTDRLVLAALVIACAACSSSNAALPGAATIDSSTPPPPSSSDDPPADAGCTRGGYVACQCADGTSGTKRCREDGQSFDACTCGGSATANAIAALRGGTFHVTEYDPYDYAAGAAPQDAETVVQGEVLEMCFGEDSHVTVCECAAPDGNGSELFCIDELVCLTGTYSFDAAGELRLDVSERPPGSEDIIHDLRTSSAQGGAGKVTLAAKGVYVDGLFGAHSLLQPGLGCTP